MAGLLWRDSDDGGEDLYLFYVEYMETARLHFERTLRDPCRRARIDEVCHILPREHFEAGLERSASTAPEALAKVIEWLRRGFAG